MGGSPEDGENGVTQKAGLGSQMGGKWGGFMGVLKGWGDPREKGGRNHHGHLYGEHTGVPQGRGVPRRCL